MNRAEHWESVYATKPDAELSWYQQQPEVSLRLIRELASNPHGVVDIGGGQSALAPALVDLGIPRVVVLDVSPSAIRRGRERAGASADRIEWIAGDVLRRREYGDVDCWHDRAVFHFLTDAEERASYVDAAARAIPTGGHAVIGAFAMSGPERCSGLEVRRYDAGLLASEFAGAFVLHRSFTETHMTPWGKGQDFIYTVLERR
ncbi:MAG: class I SAM-dependent methyltransferase [Phycisphaeraceae bacterium]|nr:class I SAM-dependent methyltransferase [Phycisphaeraceae bacterium]